jgi:GAF domain-containing protein
MPIDPALLAKSIAALTDPDPQRDLAATLEQAVVAVKQLFAVDAAGVMLAGADGKLRWASASDPLAQSLENSQEVFAAGPCLQAFLSGQPAVMHDATLEPRWRELTVAFGELQVRSGLSVPVELGGGPIGTLDVYAAAPGGGTRRRSARCKPVLGWSRPCSGWPLRPTAATGWPSSSGLRWTPGS